MFLKSFTANFGLYRKYLISRTDKLFIFNKLIPSRGYGYSNVVRNHKFDRSHSRICVNICHKCQVQRHYSKGLLDGDISDLQNAQKEREITKLSTLYPNPRVTLNELAAKSPGSVFDIHYKQIANTPKGGRKKTVQNDWTCTYSFVWPQKIKFEGTAISKRHAAEKAAMQALHWLYINKRIDNKGRPVFDKTVIDDLNSSLQEPIKASISENSMERIQRIWDDYENGIKEIYDATFEAAKRRLVSPPAAITKDSTIDEEDGLSGDELKSTSDADDLPELKIPVHPVYGKHVPRPTETALDRRKRQLMRTFDTYDRERTPLPIDDYSDAISSTVSSSRVSVLVGAAGCGKSTRAPAAVLRARRDAAVIVSGPRRVAAVGLAGRVAGELGEQVGETVGYQVRLDSRPPRPPAGSILYCTSGVLLRRLQTNPGLLGCSHVFIDEAHERDVNTDVSLLLLKRAIDLNPDLRVIVMSATLDTEVFTRYFDACPVIEVPGRTFPVQTSYLDDISKQYNLELSNTLENCRREGGKPQINCQEVVEVIKAVDRQEPEGAILVFLPGWAEIKQTKLLLDQCYGGGTHMVLPVHSRLSTTDQAKMFSKPLPGIRKIVVATNIAETSVTIPDVVYVLDSGAHKENRIMEGTGTASLETVWVSQAGAKQRAGRAGRVQPGVEVISKENVSLYVNLERCDTKMCHCFKLYTKEKENDFVPFTTPEILRVPLEQTVLDCKTYAPGDKVEKFLSQLPEPPTQKAIQFAVNDLIDLGALSVTEQLTRLGSVVSALPLPPRLALALLAAGALGQAAAGARVAAFCADNVEVFRDAHDRREEIREIKRQFNPTSDHVALHRIQEEYERIVRERGRQGAEQWCERLGLRQDRLRYVTSITNLYLEQLVRSPMGQLCPDADQPRRFPGVDELSPGALLCGADALLACTAGLRAKGKLAAELRLRTSKGDRAHIGGESVNRGACWSLGALFAYCGGLVSRERRALVVRGSSRVSAHAAAVFCRGQLHKSESTDDTTILNLPRHRLNIHVPTSQVDHILRAREMFTNTLQYYIEREPKEISYEENTNVFRFKARLAKAIGQMLVEAHREFEEKKEAEFR